MTATTTKKPVLFIVPPDRTQELKPEEKAVLVTAYGDWNNRLADMDEGGNYRLKANRRKLAPWNKLVKSLFSRPHDFHQAATLHKKTGEVFDPTQAVKFVSYGTSTHKVLVAIEMGGVIVAQLADTAIAIPASGQPHNNAVYTADVMADALNAYALTHLGERSVRSLLERLGVTDAS
jgi:hypothetical protein